MRWIEALVECSDTTGAATARFMARHFAVADGAVLETALVECAAQTMAAALGQRARAGGKATPGFSGMLAGGSNFSIATVPPLDQELRIEIRELRRLGMMTKISATISCAGQVIASGELTLYA